MPFHHLFPCLGIFICDRHTLFLLLKTIFRFLTHIFSQKCFCEQVSYEQLSGSLINTIDGNNIFKASLQNQPLFLQLEMRYAIKKLASVFCVYFKTRKLLSRDCFLFYTGLVISSLFSHFSPTCREITVYRLSSFATFQCQHYIRLKCMNTTCLLYIYTPSSQKEEKKYLHIYKSKHLHKNSSYK